MYYQFGPVNLFQLQPTFEGLAALEDAGFIPNEITEGIN